MKSIFRSAITDAKGDVDVGYLALMWGLVGWGVAGSTVLIVGTLAAWRNPAADAAAIIQSMGIAITGVSGGFATMLGAVGLFRLGDKDHAAPTTTTTTTISTETAAPALPVKIVDMPGDDNAAPQSDEKPHPVKKPVRRAHR